MGKKKSHEQFIKEVLEKHGEDYTIISLYVNSSTKVDVKHKCGHTYDVLPHNILAGYGCPKCGGTLRKTHEEFQKEFDEVYQREYKLLGKYINAYTKIAVEHIVCGHKYKAFPVALRRGDICPVCSPKHKKDTEEFIKMIYELAGDEYKVLGEYTGALKPVLIKHVECGNEYDAYYNNFKAGARCPICSMWERASKRAFTHEEFINKIHELTGSDYEVLGKYKNKRTKIKMKHIECGSEFDMRAGDFMYGTRCPKCDLSKGEQAVKDFLVSNDVKFDTQYKFDGCRHKQKLSFDFALLHDNDEVSALIEFQGIQHYKATNYFDGQAKLDRQQRNDAIKRKFCKEQNISLIEIPYWDLENVSAILKESISQ